MIVGLSFLLGVPLKGSAKSLLKFLVKCVIILGIIGTIYLNRNQLLSMVKNVNTPKEAAILLGSVMLIFLVLFRLAFGSGSLMRLAERTVSSFFIDGIKLIVKGVLVVILPGYKRMAFYFTSLLSKLIK